MRGSEELRRTPRRRSLPPLRGKSDRYRVYSSQAASASPIGVDGGPSTIGQSSSAMRAEVRGRAQAAEHRVQPEVDPLA